MAGLILLPSFLKAKVPTRHEQAPSYYEKKLLVRSIFMEQALEVTMYTCISVYMYSLTHYRHACFKHLTTWTKPR